MPGETFTGPLPLDVRRGTATLGIHTEKDRRTDSPTLVDGKISVADLLIYADEFDAQGGTYAARDFLVSLLPDVVGTEERERHLEARASLINTITKASGE